VTLPIDPLKLASASRLSGQRSVDDYDVLADAVVVRLLQGQRLAHRNAVDVDAGLRAPRGPHADARLCRDAQGRDGGVREKLATRVRGASMKPETWVALYAAIIGTSAFLLNLRLGSTQA
jgi:hypothetical protein